MQALMDQIREEAERKITTIKENPRFQRLLDRWIPCWKSGQIPMDLSPIDLILSADTVDDGFIVVEDILRRAELSDPKQIPLPF